MTNLFRGDYSGRLNSRETLENVIGPATDAHGLTYPLARVIAMMVRKAFRFELDPTNVQRTSLAQHAGTARFAFNWGLAERKRILYEGEGTTSAIAQHKAWNQFKREGAPWWTKASKCAPQEALRDLDRAMRNFFDSRKAKGGKVGFPKFKRKGRNDSFRLTGSIHADEKSVTLPRLGEIRTKEPTTKLVESGARITSATCRREADRWFVSLAVEVERPDPLPVRGEVVGIDRGLHAFAVCSDGEVIESPRSLNKGLRKLRRLSRDLSRKKPGSNNRDKARQKLARHHRKIRNRRLDGLHKATTHLAKTKQVIVVEELNVCGMIRNRHLSRAISDASWGEFSRLLRYKCQWYGSKLVVADRFFPSTKTCSGCEEVEEEVPLSQRMFVCGSCGLSIDRDLNAAINLKRYVAVSSTETQNACGGESSGQGGNVLVKLASIEESSGQVGDALVKVASGKQEPDSKARERFAQVPGNG